MEEVDMLTIVVVIMVVGLIVIIINSQRGKKGGEPSLKCKKCGEVYPSIHYFKHAEDICNGCFKSSSEE